MMQHIDVLIAEDNLIDQKLLSAYLEEYDITHIIVDSGEEAIKILQSVTFKLLLFDISLPGINGYQLTKVVKEEMKITTPVVAITAYSIDEAKDKCFASGMNACFSKPISKIELVGMLTQFLPKEKLTSAHSRDFEVIDLSYLKEISLGDLDYEMEITNKFVETIESDLLELENSFHSKNAEQLSVVAHRTLSTIYIMGLKSKLESTLCAIEQDDLTYSELKTNLEHVYETCRAAKIEAKLFIEDLRNCKSY
ncbi:response regulator [Pedobacter sp. G11]|uniref:response regulator n=1 Tax=Pedobacter sp. G11 TaxID=2482728 RepID=UPI000F60020D|nr:response regulator [Pedobacter sp. G11]AZI27748.1 response regulator [Pedobacter sp. G11]